MIGAWLIYKYDLSPKLTDEHSKENELITIEPQRSNRTIIENIPALLDVQVNTVHIDHILSNQYRYSEEDVKKAKAIRQKNDYKQNQEKEYNKKSKYGFYFLLGGFGLQLIAQVINWIL